MRAFSELFVASWKRCRGSTLAPILSFSLLGLVLGAIAAACIPFSSLDVFRNAVKVNSDAIRGDKTGSNIPETSSAAPLRRLAKLNESPILTPVDRIELTTSLDESLFADLVACLNEISGTPASTELEKKTVGAAFLKASDNDPFRMLALARTVNNGGWQDYLFQWAYEKLSHMAPETALDAIPTIPSHLRKRCEQKLIATWVKDRGLHAVDMLLERLGAKSELVASAIKENAKLNPKDTLRYVENMPLLAAGGKAGGKEGKDFYLAPALSASDPSTAVDYLSTMKPSRFRDSQMIGAIGRLIVADPVVATQAITRLKDDVSQTTVLKNAALQLAPKDPESALKIIDAIPAVRMRISAAEAIAREMFQKDPAAAASWAAAISDPVTRTVVERKIGQQFGVKPL